MAFVQAQAVPATPDSGIVPEKVRDGIDVRINGEHFRHTGDPQMPLLWYLRDVLRLTGTKYGGGNGVDLVLLDGKAVSAVAQPMAALAGREVVTVEGLAANDGSLHPVQQAFIDEDAIGCGYCTPGWLIAAIDLLALDVDVVQGIRCHDVEPEPARDLVALAVAGVDRVGPAEVVVQAVAVDLIVSGSAVDHVVAVGTEQDVPALVAEDRVVASVAVDLIVAGAAAHRA